MVTVDMNTDLIQTHKARQTHGCNHGHDVHTMHEEITHMNETSRDATVHFRCHRWVGHVKADNLEMVGRHMALGEAEAPVWINWLPTSVLGSSGGFLGVVYSSVSILG